MENLFNNTYTNEFSTIDDNMQYNNSNDFFSYPTNMKNKIVDFLKDYQDEWKLKRLGFGKKDNITDQKMNELCNVAIKNEAIGNIGYSFYRFIERYPNFFIEMTPMNTATKIFPETIMGDFTTMTIENRRYIPSFNSSEYNDISNGAESNVQMILDYIPTIRLSTTFWHYYLQSMMSKKFAGYDEEEFVRSKTAYLGLRNIIDEIRFYGFETGDINKISAYNNVFRMYGLLNHPLLDNPIPATYFEVSGTRYTSWKDKKEQGQGKLIWNDISNLVETLIANTDGLVSLPDSKIKLAMPNTLYSCLNTTLNAFETKTVMNLITETYKNIEIVQCPRLKDKEGVNWVYCTVDRVENEEYNNIIGYFGTTAKTFITNYIQAETKKTGIEISTGIAGFYPGHPKAIVRMNNI